MELVKGTETSVNSPLHSFTLYQQIETLDKAFQEYNRSIDEISDDIRCIERALKEKKITGPFTFEISHNAAAGCYFFKRITWADYKEQGFRLLHTWEVGGVDQAGESDTRPLIECKAEVRIDIYPHLSRFLAAFVDHLKGARIVRDQQMDRDASLAALGEISI